MKRWAIRAAPSLHSTPLTRSGSSAWSSSEPQARTAQRGGRRSTGGGPCRTSVPVAVVVASLEDAPIGGRGPCRRVRPSTRNPPRQRVRTCFGMLCAVAGCRRTAQRVVGRAVAQHDTRSGCTRACQGVVSLCRVSRDPPGGVAEVGMQGPGHQASSERAADSRLPTEAVSVARVLSYCVVAGQGRGLAAMQNPPPFVSILQSHYPTPDFPSSRCA